MSGSRSGYDADAAELVASKKPQDHAARTAERPEPVFRRELLDGEDAVGASAMDDLAASGDDVAVPVDLIPISELDDRATRKRNSFRGRGVAGKTACAISLER